MGLSMRLVAENRHEIWVSFGVGLFGLVFAAPMPMGYGNVLALAACLLISLCCAINAVLDLEDMSISGKFFAVIWLAIVLVATVWVLIWAFGIRDFANK
jgi:hypothetical protein